MSLAAALALLAATAIGGAQGPAISAAALRCLDCPLTGQSPRSAAVDPSAVQYVESPQAFVFRNRGTQTALLARVLRTSPLIIDVIDEQWQSVDGSGTVIENEILGPRERGTCGIHVVSHVKATERTVVSTLAFNDLITATRVHTVREPLVLANMQKVTAAPPFHLRGEADSCVNQSGRLIHYRAVDGHELTIYNDGGIEYLPSASYRPERDRLSPGERGALLKAFAAVDFDRLPESIPKPNWSPDPSVTLSGMRHQRVSLFGHGDRLTPLVAQLEGLAGKAAAHARYRLMVDSPASATILPWPVPEVDLDRYYDLVEAAAQQARHGAGKVPGDFAAMNQPAPASIPLYEYSIAGRTDPNRHTFFSQNGKLYRVVRHTDCDNRPCRMSNLVVEDVLVGGASLDIPAVSPDLPPGRLTAGRPRTSVADPSSPRGVKAIRLTQFAWLWPVDARPALRDVPSSGIVIDSATFNRHRALYTRLLHPSGSGGNGWRLLEGDRVYVVRLCHVGPGDPAGACELRP